MAPNGENFNEDELHAPQWIDAEFFTKVLREYEGDATIEVKNLKMSPASAKGDHYASIMFRFLVEYQQQGHTKSKSFIIKTMPEIEGTKKEMLQESFIFHTENAMYTEVLPKFEAMLKDVGEDIKLGAPCVYTSLEPNQLTVFEDAVPLGYTVVRDRTLTLEEVKGAYLKLAKIHALSYKLNLEKPDDFDKFQHNLMTLDITDSYKDACSNFVAMLKQEPSLHEYIPFFDALKDSLLEKAKSSYMEYRDNRQESSTYVLCHGDFHYKNLMIKSNPSSGKLEDVMLLDFQISYIGPIVNDIIYSFYVLMNSEQRLEHFDELLYHYFSNFVDTLKKLGFEGYVPKLSDLKRQLMEHKHLELFLMVTFLPAWKLFTDGQMDVDKFLNSEDYRVSLYSDANYKDEVKKLLPRYKHLGYFEN